MRLAQAGAEGAALYLKCWLLNRPGPAQRWDVNLPLRSLRKRGPSSVLDRGTAVLDNPSSSLSTA